MQEQLIKDLKAVLREADDLLDTTPGVKGGKLEAARAKLGSNLQMLRQRWNQLEDKALKVGGTTRRIVKEHPYETMGAGILTAVFLAGAVWVWRLSR